MKGARSSRHSSTKGAIVRLILAAIAITLGYRAVTISRAMVLQTRSPEEAHALAPDDGFITGRLARSLSDPSAASASRDRAVRLARLAVRQEPASLDAVVALGLNAQLRGDAAAARRLFGYSGTLSRRDLQTQLWMIDDAISREDIPATLFHYDIALRTSRDAAGLLFPVLSTAISDPAIRSALVGRLARQPAWSGAFESFVVANDAVPEATVALLEALSARGVAVPDRVSANLVGSLIANGNADLAWAYYSAIRPGARRAASRDPDFQISTQAPTALDWVPVNARAVSAAIQPAGNGRGVLTFTAPPSVGGPAATQFELLPPGDYDLVGESRGIDQLEDSHPYWSLRCRDGRELGRVDVPNSAQAQGHYSGRLTVPTDCPVQILALILRPSSKISGVSGQIERTLLRSAR